MITNFDKTREMREIMKVVKKAFSEGQFREKKNMWKWKFGEMSRLENCEILENWNPLHAFIRDFDKLIFAKKSIFCHTEFRENDHSKSQISKNEVNLS